MRMQVARLIQQLASGHPSEPLSRENHGDLLPGRRKILESGKRLLRGSHAHDAVVPRVAVAQLSLDVLECPRILLNGNKRGPRHLGHFSAGSVWRTTDAWSAAGPHGRPRVESRVFGT